MLWLGHVTQVPPGAILPGLPSLCEGPWASCRELAVALAGVWGMRPCRHLLWLAEPLGTDCFFLGIRVDHGEAFTVCSGGAGEQRELLTPRALLSHLGTEGADPPARTRRV